MPTNRTHEGHFVEYAVGSSKVFREGDLLHCAHCGNSVVCCGGLRKRPRNWCAKCDHYICDVKTCNDYCTPIDWLLDMGQRYPTFPALGRGPGGTLLFDPAILEKGRIF
jgi:hypothetical protein